MPVRIFTLTVACLGLLAQPAEALIGKTRSAQAFAAHTIMVLKRNGPRSSFCSGVLLTRRIVLTSAHCVAHASDTRVHFKDGRGAAVLLEPRRILRHSAYRADAIRTRRASVDLALIEMEADLPSSFEPAELAVSETAPPGETFVVAGYGEREDGSVGAIAAIALTLREPLSTILMWLVASNPPGGACEGDSGAPVFDSERRVIAIVAFAEGIGERRCGTLTQAIRVAPQRAWIEATIAKWAR